MIGTIKLTRFTSTPDAEYAFARHNWPLVVYASSTGAMPDDVFVFQKHSGNDPAGYDTFHNVASAHDVFEIPTRATTGADGENDTPFYRAAQLRLFLRHPEEVEEIWGKLKRDVIDLVRNLEAENRLKAVDTTTVTPLDTTPVSVEETVDALDQIDQVLLTLDYRPAGIAEVDSDNNQTISSPDDSLTGWLPVSEAPGSWTVPANAKFFYNTAQDAAVAAELPFLQPGNVHLCYVNGGKLTHGSTYHITAEGIFWLDFEAPADEGEIILGDGELLYNENLTGNAPWPLDYVDRGSPGSTIPDLQLLLFRE